QDHVTAVADSDRDGEHRQPYERQRPQLRSPGRRALGDVSCDDLPRDRERHHREAEYTKGLHDLVQSREGPAKHLQNSSLLCVDGTALSEDHPGSSCRLSTVRRCGYGIVIPYSARNSLSSSRRSRTAASASSAATSLHVTLAP